MRAITLSSAGSAPTCSDFPEPAPRPGHETLELVGAGLHQVVRSIATGQHYGSSNQYPLVPGVDAVARGRSGGLVYAAMTEAPWGTMAERLAPSVTVDLPAGADPLAIAAGMNPGMSGWMPLVAHREERGALGTVLVLGATGMAGRMAAQAAIALGARRVLGAGRDAGSLMTLQAAGVEPIDLADPRALERAVAAATPDLVLDYVWGPVAEAAFAALGRRGLDADEADISYVQIGSLAGADASVPASLLRSRRLRLTGSGSGTFSPRTAPRRAPDHHGEDRRRLDVGAVHRVSVQQDRGRVGARGALARRRRAGVKAAPGAPREGSSRSRPRYGSRGSHEVRRLHASHRSRRRYGSCRSPGSRRPHGSLGMLSVCSPHPPQKCSECIRLQGDSRPQRADSCGAP